jgi:hypothetical protein
MIVLFPEIKTAIQIKRSGGGCSDAVRREQFASPDTKLHNQVRFDLLLTKVLVCFLFLWADVLPDSVQSAWQSFVAYDACFRLCLNAWAKNCMEAPEFLRDECMVLRSAFGYGTTHA